MPDVTIPKRIAKNCSQTVVGMAWLDQLPSAITHLRQRWSLTLSEPFEDESSCSWVAPCIRQDGTAAVLKLGMPHMEARSEIDGLIFWNGDPTVFVLESAVELNAMLLEHCQPGIPLCRRPEHEQDEVIAKLLRRLWRIPPKAHPFRHLSEMTASWSKESLEKADSWFDAGLIREGLRIFEELSNNASSEVLLATDLHAGNVLQAQREPWLVIDPKPFVGDPTYDATQHLFNCDTRLRLDPEGMIRRFSDLLIVDHERVHLWLFARAAVEASDDELVRALAP